mmetsp:Transcript_81266/g.224972  ORF Transcript_81266/g.224972 Transcript_81266/m.224972 type:complete len:221 (-) Transcript_81266:36-698(-)
MARKPQRVWAASAEGRERSTPEKSRGMACALRNRPASCRSAAPMPRSRETTNSRQPQRWLPRCLQTLRIAAATTSAPVSFVSLAGSSAQPMHATLLARGFSGFCLRPKRRRPRRSLMHRRVGPSFGPGQPWLWKSLRALSRTALSQWRTSAKPCNSNCLAPWRRRFPWSELTASLPCRVLPLHHVRCPGSDPVPVVASALVPSIASTSSAPAPCGRNASA